MPRSRALALGCILSVYLSLYLALFMPLSFLPASVTGLRLGTYAVGSIVAAYPAATVLATPLPPTCISLVGIRNTIALGLALTALAMASFGTLPWLLAESNDVGLVRAR